MPLFKHVSRICHAHSAFAVTIFPQIQHLQNQKSKIKHSLLPHFRLAKPINSIYNARVSRKIQVYTGGSVGCNGYLIQGNDGYVAVDAPMGMADWVCRQLPEGAKLTHLLLTHQHFDHVEGAAELQRRTGCTIHAVAPYSKTLTLEEAVGAWGLPPVEPYTVDDVLGTAPRKTTWAGMEWQILPIAGHATDGAAYYLAEEDEVFVGDILFAGSVGRTDFPGGSMSTLVRGIREHLMPLPPHTTVNSGHGPASSIGEEQLNNPYIC